MANYGNNNYGNGGNTNRYNNQNQNSVNTNSIPMFNNDMCLRMSFMNDSLSLSFIPVTIRDDGSRSFPKENGQWCVIKLEYAVLMHNWLKQYFIPQAKSNFDKQLADPSIELPPVIIGVPINKDNTNMLVFKYTKPKNDTLVPTITLHTGIGENRIPTKSSTYEFGTKRIFTQYDETTGDYAFNMDQVQFWVFLKTLECFIEASTMAEVHAEKMGNSYVNREMRGLIRQIAQKNGIATMNYAGGNGNGGGGFDTAPALPAVTTSDNTANVTTVSEMFGVETSDLPF